MELGFLIKKLISAMIMPLSIGLIIGLFGLYSLFTNKINRAKLFLTLSFIFIILISYVPIANFLIKPLETKYETLQTIPKDVKYIVLLGGDFENRAWEVLRLYSEIKNAKIITSGYARRGEISEAVKSTNKLLSVGVKKEDIITFTEPKDTKEEAKKLKEFLKGERFILVSSSYHLPRAVALFKKEGLDPIVSTSHYTIKESDKALSMPDGESLEKTERALHEYIGMFWAKLRGQI